jgi:hypothetical protein
MATQHTPGPWHDTGLPVGYDAAISDEAGRCIAHVHRIGSIPMAEAEANARLIAAAPDMLPLVLAALAYQAAADEEHRLYHDKSYGHQSDEWAEAARARNRAHCALMVAARAYPAPDRAVQP